MRLGNYLSSFQILVCLRLSHNVYRYLTNIYIVNTYLVCSLIPSLVPRPIQACLKYQSPSDFSNGYGNEATSFSDFHSPRSHWLQIFFCK